MIDAVSQCPVRFIPAGLALVAAPDGRATLPGVLIMADTPKKLSDTARAVLTHAATRDDHLAQPPKLPIAAVRQVIRSLLNASLLEEVPAPIADAAYAWRNGEDGGALMLQATASGLARIGVQAEPATGSTIITEAAREGKSATGANASAQEPAVAEPAAAMPASASQALQEPHCGQDDARGDETAPTTVPSTATPQAAPMSPARANRQATLRQAAQALLDAWHDPANRERDVLGMLDGLFPDLRAALAVRITSSTDNPRQPKDTKQSQVLAMLRSPDGATVAQIAEAMSWEPHTVRGFFAGLKKRRGIAVIAAERVRQVGPNKTGAKGSFTIYRVAG
jgi:hypothetical protein